MLRAVSGPGPEGARVSIGSAGVLGLEACLPPACCRQGRQAGPAGVPPTTAYLMVGDRCAYDCAFCAQARSSGARADQLSRVTWPSYPLPEVIQRLAAAYERGAIQRCCLQVTAGPGYAGQARLVAQQIKAASAVPLCVSIRVTDMALFDDLLALGRPGPALGEGPAAPLGRTGPALGEGPAAPLGVERVTLALDAACERVYERVKGGGWQAAAALLRSAARRYPGRVGTHLIVGLGESEAEAATMLQEMHDAGITTGLFAFTPVPGTALAAEPPPALSAYRRLQVARYLIVGGHVRAEGLRYTAGGQIVSYGLAAATLEALLRDGEAFRTSGCPGCNRPYYNERPSGPLYNYPRRLDQAEVASAVAEALGGSAGGQG